MENVSSIKISHALCVLRGFFFFFSQFLSSLSHGLLSFSQPSYQAKLLSLSLLDNF